MAYSNYLRDLIIDRTLLDPAIFPDGLFLSLHDRDPGLTGNNELEGGAYTRLSLPLVRSGPGAVVNEQLIEFEDLPRSTVAYWGLWSARAEGQFLAGGPLLTPFAVAEGQNLRWRESDLVIRIG